LIEEKNRGPKISCNWPFKDANLLNYVFYIKRRKKGVNGPEVWSAYGQKGRGIQKRDPSKK
jgi:hypothetical protein